LENISAIAGDIKLIAVKDANSDGYNEMIARII